MKKTSVLMVIVSMLSTPGISSAQTVDPAQLVVEPTSVVTTPSTTETTTVAQPVTVTSAPRIGVPNPALDVSYCGSKFIYKSGTYDVQSKPVISPICTLYDVRGKSYATANFETSGSAKMYHIEVHNDGKIVFTDMMNPMDIAKHIIQGETDSKYYYVSRNDVEVGITELPIYVLKLNFGENFRDKVVYFDDSIVYSYKIVK